MPDHPPEHAIRRGEEAAKQADPHGVGKQGEAGGEAHEPKGHPTADRHETETAHSKTGRG